MKNLHNFFLMFSLIFLSGIVTISQAQTYTWTGNTDTDWTKSGNWTGAAGIPTAGSSVIIPNRPNDPVISSTDVITISELQVQADAVLSIQTSGVLNVTKSVSGSTNTCITNDGTIINEGAINLTENGATTSTAFQNNGVFQNKANGNLANDGDLNIMDVSENGINNAGTFSNLSNSDLNISKTGGVFGIHHTSGLFTNNASIIISEGSSVTGSHGIKIVGSSTTFTNGVNGVIDITTSRNGLSIEEGATLNNNGIIYCDEITLDAIALNSELVSIPTFNNNAGGVININQRNSSTSRVGILLIESYFNNTGGRINIDGTSAEALSKGIQLSDDAIFTNEEGGIINLGERTNDLGTSAISIFKGIFVNTSCSGIINHSTQDEIRVNDFATGTFTNSGWIQSYCNTNSKISNNYGTIVNYGSGTFTYDGGVNNPLIEPGSTYTHVWIGEDDADWTNLCNWAADALPDATSGVWVERELFNPIVANNLQIQALGISDENTSSLTINSGVTLTVDGSPGVGVLVKGGLANNGTLDIDHTAAAGLHLSNSITLGGKTYIGKTGNVSGAGILTDAGAILGIGLCSEIYVYKKLIINANINNEGFLLVNTTETHSGTITNDGVLNFPVGSSGLTIINNDLLISPFNLEGCSAGDVLSIGSSNDFTPATSWYSDVAKTNALGTYNTGSNALDLSITPVTGTGSVYFTVSGNGCHFNAQTQYINEVPANNTITWEGTVDNEWTEACNWNPAIVPTANEDVLIPDQANDPFIRNGIIAEAKSLLIQSSAHLTIQNGGRINITNSDGDGVYNQGMIECEFNSLFTISNATGNGLYNASGGIINNRGVISITEPDGHGLVNDNGTFNNNANGTIDLPMSNAPIGKNGIEQLSGNFFNHASAYVFPNVPNGNGVNVSGGTLTTEGLITGFGDLTVAASGTLMIIVNGKFPSTQYGQIVLNPGGVANLDGTISATVNYTPGEGDRIPFINSASSISGTFASENLPPFWSTDYSVGSEVALVHCTTAYYADTDGDGYGDPAVSGYFCTMPTGYVTDNTDCNDSDPNVNPAPDCSTTTRTWTGHVSTDWNEACNWSPNCVPTASEDVVIPDVVNDPVIADGTTIVVKSMVIENGGIMTNHGHLTMGSGDIWIKPGAALQGDGTYIVQGDWVNDGSFTAGSSFVGMRGNVQIRGASTSIFYELSAFASNTTLAVPIRVDHILYMSLGTLNLNGHDLTLFSTATIQGETSAGYIFSTNGGVVKITNALNAPAAVNLGNIGVTISSAANLSLVTIQRGYTVQNVNGEMSIGRYYDITPLNNSGLDATVRFSYLDHELNGIAENDLTPFRFNGTDWDNYPVTASDATANWVETQNVDAFSKWTLAPECNLATFYADTDGDGYGDPAVSVTDCVSPNGYVTDNTDCDDNDLNEFPGQTWYQDADGDGYTTGTNQMACERPAGYRTASELVNTTSLDCNDGDANVSPNPDCSGTIRTWTGHVSTDWDEACNWSPNCLPTAADDVLILFAANTPIISATSTVSVKSVTVWSALTISSGGTLTIDGASSIGLDNSGGSVLNEGTITIDNTGSHAIRNRSGTTFTNNGTINIGQNGGAGNISGSGILNTDGGSPFNNNGFQINIDNTGGNGIMNRNGSTFTNAATLNIGQNGGVGNIQNNGIANSSSGIFKHNSAQLNLDNTVNHGIFNATDGNFTNGATIFIGAIGAPGGSAIENGLANFNNNACAVIEITSDNIISNSGNFSNSGLLIENASGNSSISTNNGIVNNLNGGSFSVSTNNEIIVEATTATDCSSISPAFLLGPTVDFNIMGVFTDANATQSAGMYDVATNTFTPVNALLQFGTIFYVKIEDITGGCTHIVAWLVNASLLTFYADTDGDGFGDPMVSIAACSAPSAYVADNTDCDDSDADEFPGQNWYIDADGDGYGSTSTTACERPANAFLLSELIGNGTDDCDDGDANEFPDQVWYEDADEDGVSNGAMLTRCERPAGYFTSGELSILSGDNCPELYNPSQTDTDGFGIGDACDCDPDSADDEYLLIIDNSSLPDGTYQANREMEVTTTVVTGTSVTLTAGRKIRLLPGFVAEAGSDLYAYIDSCETPEVPTSAVLNKSGEVAGQEQLIPNTAFPESDHPSNPELEVFPNPFNTEVVIRFHLQEAGQASLNLFDLQGRLVHQLHYGQLDRGQHQWQWNGTGRSGHRLPSGMYLVQLRSANVVVNKKVLFHYN